MSAARETAKTEAAAAQAKLEEKADNADKRATAAEQRAAAAETKVAQGGGGPATPPAPPVTGPGGVDISKGTAFDTRIAADITPQVNQTLFVNQSNANPAIPGDKSFVITDLILQNPRGDIGTIRILRGDQILYEFGLGNFRDYDYHSIAPLTFPPDKKLQIAVSCQTAGGSDGKCRPSVTFSGHLAG